MSDRLAVLVTNVAIVAGLIAILAIMRACEDERSTAVEAYAAELRRQQERRDETFVEECVEACERSRLRFVRAEFDRNLHPTVCVCEAP